MKCIVNTPILAITGESTPWWIKNVVTNTNFQNYTWSNFHQENIKILKIKFTTNMVVQNPKTKIVKGNYIFINNKQIEYILRI